MFIQTPTPASVKQNVQSSRPYHNKLNQSNRLKITESSCQSESITKPFTEISEILGAEITKIEILRHPTKKPKYLFYFKGFKRPVVMNSTEVLSRLKFAKACCLYVHSLPQSFKVKSQGDWYRLIAQAMENARKRLI